MLKFNDCKLSSNINENIQLIKRLFNNDDNLKIRKIVNNLNPKVFCYIAFLNGMVDSDAINDSIVKPFVMSKINYKNNNLHKISTEVVFIGELQISEDIKEIVEGITSGDTLLFLNNESKVLILNTKGFDYRSISEPDSEKVLIGPREGFTESLIVNVALLQRRFRTNNFKTKYIGIGKQTNTNVCICYVESVVNEKLLNDIYQKLKEIEIDAIIDSNYIAELINGENYSSFKRYTTTERPDSVVGKILEGRIAILVDGSPVALVIPYLFIENFQNPEDYYISSDFASFSRILRIIGFAITILTPGLYIAITSFHPEIIPTQLFMNFALERQKAPLPAGLEIAVMLFVFELLKETGVRMPSNIGDALSIVGALVIGQAAVDASMVSAPVIIIVGITGICSLLVPKLEGSIILFRFLILFFSIFLGLLGFVLGLSILIINVLNQESFGFEQIHNIDSFSNQELKDRETRQNWKKMIMRPLKITKNKKRQK